MGASDSRDRAPVRDRRTPSLNRRRIPPDGVDGTRRRGSLERPWSRTPVGFDTQDWTLDVVASTGPDGTWSVRYKDEDELEFYAQTGHWPQAMRSIIESAGEEAVSIAHARAFPFDADWSQWIPDARWPAAMLPAKWNLLP